MPPHMTPSLMTFKPRLRKNLASVAVKVRSYSLPSLGWEVIGWYGADLYTTFIPWKYRSRPSGSTRAPRSFVHPVLDIFEMHCNSTIINMVERASAVIIDTKVNSERSWLSSFEWLGAKQKLD